MPKRKHFPKLPSGYGSVRFLGKNRRLPYAVHPPSTERDANGFYIRPKALCYVPDWYTGFAVLSAYHAGKYEPGMEVTISEEVNQSDVNLDAFCKRVLQNRGMVAHLEKPTLADVYEKYWEWKFGSFATRQLSDSAKSAYKQGYNYLSVLKDKSLDDITIEQLQNIVNECDKKKATRQNIVLTAKQLWKFAMSREMCEKNTAQYLVVPDGRENEHGVALTEDELKLLWANKDREPIAIALIMCYSGFRISALRSLGINMEELYFRGGIKTDAGKNRIVPIHSAIVPLVRQVSKPMVPDSNKYRETLYPVLTEIGIADHTPHDFRHTFSALCERYGVREADRKRMLGHSFGGDITNAIYGHRTVEELRSEIEKIQVPK